MGSWEPTLETVACDLCAADDAEPLMWAEDTRYGVPGRFRVVRCRVCELVYVNPRPAAESLGRYYPAEYMPHKQRPQHASGIGARARDLVFGALGAAGEPLRWLYNTLAFRAFAARSPGGRVLDVGCGPGDYLRAWQGLGWEVEGLEPNAAVAERASRELGAKVHIGFVEDVALSPERFDVVSMSHSLEHMRSPRAVLRQLHASLVPGGRLIAMVPNFAAWDRKVFGAMWYGLEVPRHLYQFEPRTLRAMLESCGFSVLQLGGSAHPHGVVANAARVVTGEFRTELPRVANAAMTALLLPAAALRRSTSLWVVARKPADQRS